MNDPDAQLPTSLHLCRFCGQLLGPIYGRVKCYPVNGLFSPSGIRRLADSLAGDRSGTYFECYECEARRNRKRLIFWGLLAALVVGAHLFRHFSASDL
jgi:hypothetical protein